MRIPERVADTWVWGPSFLGLGRGLSFEGFGVREGGLEFRGLGLRRVTPGNLL